jgi:Rieske Fe-S protein
MISTPKDPHGDESAANKEPVWREQFPIDIPDDEYRSRRDFTKLMGLTSLAFVTGQCFIVAQSMQRRARGPLPEREIARAEELANGQSKVFHYPDEGDACVLVRTSKGGYVAYGQKCTHLSCPVIPKPEHGEFHCPCHEGSFDLYTGQPLTGPPRRALPKVKLEIRDGRIFANGFEEET